MIVPWIIKLQSIASRGGRGDLTDRPPPPPPLGSARLGRPRWNFYLPLPPCAAVGLISLLYPIGAEVIAYFARVRVEPREAKGRATGLSRRRAAVIHQLLSGPGKAGAAGPELTLSQSSVWLTPAPVINMRKAPARPLSSACLPACCTRLNTAGLPVDEDVSRDQAPAGRRDRQRRVRTRAAGTSCCLTSSDTVSLSGSTFATSPTEAVNPLCCGVCWLTRWGFCFDLEGCRV